MGTTNRFSRDEVQRILNLTPKQLDYWDRLRLVSSRREQGNRFYDCSDLIGLRTVKQLTEQGVPANRLRRALVALRDGLSHVHAPLSGQFVLNFEIRELGERVRAMPGRSAEEWFATALECESDTGNMQEAISAYERALHVDPKKFEALINCGTIHYEQGNFEKASEYFERAVDSDPQSSLAHANLGSVLEEVGKLEEAREHLRLAIRF